MLVLDGGTIARVVGVGVGMGGGLGSVDSPLLGPDTS